MPVHVSASPTCQLKVKLLNGHLSIWRRLWVPGDITLAELHTVLQVSMGWEDCHMHAFVVGKQRYGIPEDECSENESNVCLSQVLKKTGSKLRYEYDFGDCWQHEITLEQVNNDEIELTAPVCVEGHGACPPEDCGGTGGYADLLEAISNKRHPQHKELLDWLGSAFDHELFDRNSVNERLKRLC